LVVGCCRTCGASQSVRALQDPNHTNDKSELGRYLSRDVTQRTAIAGQDQEPSALKIEPTATQQTTHAPEQDETQGIGHELAM
jgi:hypothetical protein